MWYREKSFELFLLTPYLPRFSVSEMQRFKSIAVREEVYDLIKERAKKGFRGISSQVEYELTRKHY